MISHLCHFVTYLNIKKGNYRSLFLCHLYALCSILYALISTLYSPLSTLAASGRYDLAITIFSFSNTFNIPKLMDCFVA
jgi:hypothetical protein